MTYYTKVLENHVFVQKKIIFSTEIIETIFQVQKEITKIPIKKTPPSTRVQKPKIFLVWKNINFLCFLQKNKVFEI